MSTVSNALRLRLNRRIRDVYFQDSKSFIMFCSILRRTFFSLPTYPNRYPVAIDELEEINRCLFLHRGVGANLHPIHLQDNFRTLAKAALQRDHVEEPTKKLLNEILRRSDFVYLLVVQYVWPAELKSHRVLVIADDEYKTKAGLHLFNPVDGPKDEAGKWKGFNVILRLVVFFLPFMILI